MTEGVRTAPGAAGRLPRTPARRAATGRTAAARAAARNAGARRNSKVPFALVIAAALAGGLVLLLGLNTMSAANELRRHSLSEQDTVIAARLQQLHDEVALSQAPNNLARAAEALGMVPAGNPAFLVIGKNGKVRVLGSAAPATAAPLPVQPPPAPVEPNKKKKKKTDAPLAPTTEQKKTDSPKTDKTKTDSPKTTAPGSTETSTTATHTPAPKPTVTLGGTR